MSEERLEEGRPIHDRPYLKARKDLYTNIPKLYEVELHLLNDNPINDNEDAAWEIIQGAYYNILFNDSHWHFFWEGKFNLIRCSKEFYDEVIEYLEECGVTYIEKGEWSSDGSSTVECYKPIYTSLFHQFSMMALEKYDDREAGPIFDRVAHCFLNHQYFALKNYREIIPFPELWESKIISENAMYRSNYIGYCTGVNKVMEYHKERASNVKANTIAAYEYEKRKELGYIRKLVKKTFKL